ncbi:MAG: phosphatidate cytidylyltransferase, partial [Planctomycetota bacterium]
MLGWRLLMSAILIPLIITIFWLDHRAGVSAPLLLVFAGFVAVRNAFELTDLMAARSMKPHFAVTAVLSVAVIAAAWSHTWFAGEPVSLMTSVGWIGIALILAFCLLLGFEAFRYQEPGTSMESLGSNMVTVLYAGGLMAVTSQLRWFPKPELGYFAIASMIICVKAGDTFAYTFGRLWGKRKLAPKLSPGKTQMGLVGAIFGSTLGGFLWLTFGGLLFAADPIPSSLINVLLY